MPYILFQNAGSLTTEQKRQLAEKFTAAVTEVTGKPASATYLVMQEVNRDNWSVGGELLSDRDAKSK